MNEFTGYQYTMIDVANNAPFGLDKLVFEKRIAWVEENEYQLEKIAETEERWKERPLYIKAVMALRKAQKGKATGHMTHLDAVCSGMQIASALTGCTSGAEATGLVHPDVRSDAYTTVTDVMNNLLGGKGVTISRKDAKQSIMTSLYGSTAVPKQLFGEDTDELAAFDKALLTVAPGASALLHMLINSWNSEALSHKWILPDGYEAVIKVMVPKTTRIEVDELDHSTFTYAYEENEPTEKGLSLAANLIHSCDAYLLRSVVRRCSYDAQRVPAINNAITQELLERELGVEPAEGTTEELQYYLEHYQRSGVVDVVILDFLDENNLTTLPTQYLTKLNSILATMLQHPPFPVITVHDSYAAHPNKLNHLRKHYRNVLADMSESHMLADLLSQLNSKPIKVNKINPDLHETIRNSSYAIC